jgi:hypothetical protein
LKRTKSNSSAPSEKGPAKKKKTVTKAAVMSVQQRMAVKKKAKELVGKLSPVIMGLENNVNVVLPGNLKVAALLPEYIKEDATKALQGLKSISGTYQAIFNSSAKTIALPEGEHDIKSCEKSLNKADELLKSLETMIEITMNRSA